jgi:hypothetical protein
MTAAKGGSRTIRQGSQSKIGNKFGTFSTINSRRILTENSVFAMMGQFFDVYAFPFAISARRFGGDYYLPAGGLKCPERFHGGPFFSGAFWPGGYG